MGLPGCDLRESVSQLKSVIFVVFCFQLMLSYSLQIPQIVISKLLIFSYVLGFFEGCDQEHVSSFT